MGKLMDFMVDVLSRNLIRSKGERRIESQNEAILKSINETRAEEGKPPIVVKQREDWITKIVRGATTLIVVLFMIFVILLMIVAKLLVVPP
ncbi:MAG: hypothetical protein U9N35_06070 [Euryarchaeota archaeon]|nr:hypothetical protein [Euryarchaeota archaeon]